MQIIYIHPVGVVHAWSNWIAFCQNHFPNILGSIAKQAWQIQMAFQEKFKFAHFTIIIWCGMIHDVWWNKSVRFGQVNEMKPSDMKMQHLWLPPILCGQTETQSSTIYWWVSSVKSCLKIHLFQSSTFHVQYNRNSRPWQMYTGALESHYCLLF